jgi:DNA-directed RNA polymerase subunit RPC12/RpoP
MPIHVKLRCSECETVREEDLKMEEPEITCPACGRRMANLQQNEYVEIENNMKKQQLFSIIGIVLFAVAVILLIMWAVPHTIQADKADTQPFTDWVSGKGTQQANTGLFIASLVLGVAAMVLSIFASLKRYIIEF